MACRCKKDVCPPTPNFPSSSLVPNYPCLCPPSVLSCGEFLEARAPGLEALPGGQAELNLTFQLPSASEAVPPPSLVPQVPALHRLIHPLWCRLKTCFPKKTFSRHCKSYRHSILHKAAMAAPSLSHRKNGSRPQIALASVQRLKAVSASPMNTQVSFHHQIFPLGMENKVRHSNWQVWI